MHRELLDGEKVFVIHDLLTPEECAALIARSETLGYEPATIAEEFIPEYRNNGRANLTDEALAADLWRRVAAFLPARIDTAQACGLHERFRFYRYEAAEQFGVHLDGSVRRSPNERSLLTFMVYLSAVEEGGETNFYGPGGIVEYAIRPAPGKALVFEHRRLHEGAAVRKGRKYVLRTDVMYRWEHEATDF